MLLNLLALGRYRGRKHLSLGAPRRAHSPEEHILRAHTLERRQVILSRLKIDAALVDQHGHTLARHSTGQQGQDLNLVERLLWGGRSLGQAEAGGNQNQEQARALHGCSLRAAIPSELPKKAICHAERSEASR